MARKTRAELKEIIRKQRETIDEYRLANEHLAERVQRATAQKHDAQAQMSAVARRCSAALNGLGLIAETVQSVRREVTGA